MNNFIILTKLEKKIVKNLLEFSSLGDKIWLTDKAVISCFDLENKSLLTRLVDKCHIFILQEELLEFTLPKKINITSYQKIAEFMLTHTTLVWN